MTTQPGSLCRRERGRRAGTAGALRAAAAVGALLTLQSASRVSAQAGPLFPEPFRVEHHVEIEDGSGRFVGESVVDTYGDSWLVSERPDGSRLILDLARRELTELRPATGTYSTIALGAFGQAARELQETLDPAAGSGANGEANEGVTRLGERGVGAHDPAASEPSFSVVELAAPRRNGLAERATGAASGGSDLLAAPTVRHLLVSRGEQVEGRPTADSGIEVWVDSSIRITPAALDALDALERDLRPRVAGPGGELDTSPGRHLAAARRFAGGAIALRTERRLGTEKTVGRRSASATRPEASARIADVVTRIERLPRVPRELLEIPEGLRRVPHPLLSSARFLAEEREERRALSANGTSRGLVDGRPQ